MRALVLGHSFVRRLKKRMEKAGWELSLRHRVHLHGVGGRRIKTVYQNDGDVVRRYLPDVVFLQVGGNDITCRESPTDVFRMLERLVRWLSEELMVPTVIVGSIFCRRRPRGMSRRQYDRRKRKINLFLSRRYGAYRRGKRVFFFTHSFFRDRYFERDGVHLNDRGNRMFFYSIRTALQLALHWIRLSLTPQTALLRAKQMSQKDILMCVESIFSMTKHIAGLFVKYPIPKCHIII